MLVGICMHSSVASYLRIRGIAVKSHGLTEVSLPLQRMDIGKTCRHASPFRGININLNAVIAGQTSLLKFSALFYTFNWFLLSVEQNNLWLIAAVTS